MRLASLAIEARKIQGRIQEHSIKYLEGNPYSGRDLKRRKNLEKNQGVRDCVVNRRQRIEINAPDPRLSTA